MTIVDSIAAIGLGADVVEAQRAVAARFWADWGSRFAGLSQDRQEEVQAELELAMKQACGNGILTHAPSWDRITWDPRSESGDDPITGEPITGLDRPMPALAQQITEAGTFVALFLKIADGDTDWELIGGSGGSFPGFYEATPSPDGVGAPGNISLVAHGDHVHPMAADLKSYLFTAKLANILDKGQAYCVFSEPSEGSLFGDGLWTEGPTGTWTHNSSGPLTSDFFDGRDPDAYNPSGTPAMVDRTVFAFKPGDITGTPRSGPYLVEDVGGHYEGGMFVSTYAVLRRHPDFNSSADFTTGMAFEILHGDTFGGEWLELATEGTIVLGTTPLDWSRETEDPYPSDKALLTAAQIGDASAETVVATATTNVGDGQVTLYEAEIGYAEFETLTGTPGLAEIPAGKITVEALAKVDTATTGNTTLTFVLYKKSGGTTTVLFSYDTSAITSTEYVLKQISQVIATKAIGPSDTLKLSIKAQTTSTTDVTVSVVVNDIGHTCRLSLPVDFPVGAQEDHRQTTHRDASDQHPWSAIEPRGTATFPVSDTLVIDEDGKLELPAGNIFTVTGPEESTPTLTQISVPDCGANETVPIRLIFLVSVSIAHQTVPESGFGTIFVCQDGSHNNPLNLGGASSTAEFTYLGGQWILNCYRSTEE
jgi:hypothetical protein